MDPCIVLFPSSPKAVALAADEFKKYWRLSTGRELPEDSTAEVRLCIDPSLDAAHDEYRILAFDGGLEIAGANGRSVFYAVYDFFSRRAGCRWFWDGDVVPHNDDISLDGLDIHEKSRFEYRAIRYFAHRGLTRFQAEHWGKKEWKREIDWCLKSRLNCFMPRIGMDDTWQKAFPEIVKYPDPSAPADDNMRGFDNRVPFWDLRHRGELRRFVTSYAFDRGLMIPTDFGTMTHWYARTPVEFLKAKNPPFLPQSNNNYKQRTGLVWDVFQGEWADDYICLTEAFIDAGYGSADLLHTIGLGERMCYDDRAKNLELKKKVLALMCDKALAKYPSAKILLAGWDFYSTWKPDEIKALVRDLDPGKVIVWDYEGEASSKADGNWNDSANNFTNWGLVGKFPYTFGIFLAYENALDIRAHYDVIESRERIVAEDPFCKGYILWPESSHTDTFLLHYFTTNAWRPGQPHDSLLSGFCRDRYGDAAAAFETVWRKALPVSQLLGWWDNWGRELLAWLGQYCQGNGLVEDAKTLAAVPEAYGMLADIVPSGEFQWRDAIDLARTVGDRLAIWTHQKLFEAFFEWCDGAGDGAAVRDWCGRYLDLLQTQADILALHTDYSLCESLDRLSEEAPVVAPDFGKVLLDNASCPYCRSHQYEVAVGCYLPFAGEFTREVLRRVDAGQRERIPDEWAHGKVADCLQDLADKGIESCRPKTPRTVAAYRRAMLAARDCSAKALGLR